MARTTKTTHTALTADQIGTLVGGIAANTLRIETLETRNSDSLDFHEVAVWELKRALELAYAAGRASR
ncbi:MAG TPA: hypothetical protein VMV33_17360 [Rhodocyclaceae bacterium]|nr:hypothetical protein [Rhodocyclaceae bacterium]